MAAVEPALIRPPASLHATAVLIGEAGLLIRGPSGSGKTTLALGLLAEAARRHCFGGLVADDTVLVEVRSGRLVARPHPLTAGLVERRGLGVMPVPHVGAGVMRAVIDLVGCQDVAPERLPVPAMLLTCIEDVKLPRLQLTGDATLLDRIGVVFDFLAAFRAGS